MQSVLLNEYINECNVGGIITSTHRLNAKMNTGLINYLNNAYRFAFISR